MFRLDAAALLRFIFRDRSEFASFVATLSLRTFSPLTKWDGGRNCLKVDYTSEHAYHSNNSNSELNTYMKITYPVLSLRYLNT